MVVYSLVFYNILFYKQFSLFHLLYIFYKKWGVLR